MPIGAESEFAGLIDLVARKAYFYDTPEAIEHKIIDIPAEYAEAAEEARQHLVEKVAETDDGLMEKFLEEEEISEDELKAALRRATIALEIFPVCVGSALRHRGVHPLLDAVIDYLPSPLDVDSIKGVDPADESIELERKPSVDDPMSALAFKVVTDPHVGRLVYLRVYSGILESGVNIYNSTTRSKERIGRLLVMHADSREEKKFAGPGEIVAAIGLKDTVTGQTLCPQNA